MRTVLFFSLIFGLLSCGGALPEEQRQAIKKEMKDRQIKRVSEDDIFEKALAMGRSYVDQVTIENIDSFSDEGVVIVFADSLISNLSDKERSLFEAYSFGSKNQSTNDNVQKEGDVMIYSSPVIKSDSLQGVWFIKIPRKKIVLAL